MYSIETHTNADLPDESFVAVVDSLGLRIAILNGEHAAENAQVVAVALSHPDLYGTIQRQTREILRLQGVLAARDGEIIRLRDGLADLRSRYAEAERDAVAGEALAQYVTETM